MNSKISHYFVSSYDNSVWIVYKNDRPNKFYGMTPPKKSKYPIK